MAQIGETALHEGCPVTAYDDAYADASEEELAARRERLNRICLEILRRAAGREAGDAGHPENE